ncbi:hypothetical protein NVP2275O_415 [Vibrio phage 2.275.O._10N.286.54.E11]|nr:hypothetical protein NVP2275O_415 [Vibrio phage 2.275.O._10N.286.54.E11]
MEITMSVKRLDGREGLIVRGEKYLEIPKGPESARPESDTGARTGMIRFNTDSAIYEGFNGYTWVALVSGSWTVIDNTDSPYTAVSGENILANTQNGDCVIVLQSEAFVGDSVHISGTGFEEVNNISVIDEDTGTPLLTLDNNNSEVFIVRKSDSGNVENDWQVVDRETYIANGTSKLEIQSPGGDLVLKSNVTNTKVNFEIDSGDLLLTNNNNPSGTSNIFLENGNIISANGDIAVQNGEIVVGSSVVSSSGVTASTLASTSGTTVGGTLTANGPTVLNGTVVVSGEITGVTNTSSPQPTEAVSVQLLNDSLTNLDLTTIAIAGDGIEFQAGSPQSIAVDIAGTNSGLGFNASGELIIDMSEVAGTTVPGMSDRVLMDVGGTLSGVTRSDFLDGINTSPRDVAGTVDLNQNASNGTADNGDILDATGVDGVAPADGTEYIVVNASDNNDITGTSENYDAGDSIVWYSGAWIRIGGSMVIPTGIASFTGEQGTVYTSAYSASLGDYSASLVTATGGVTVQAELDLKADVTENNIFAGTTEFLDNVEVTGATLTIGNTSVLDVKGTLTLVNLDVTGSTILGTDNTDTVVANATITANDNVNVNGSLIIGSTPGSTSSKLSLPNGSASAPSLYFGTGSQTGFYRDSTASNGDIIATAQGQAVGAFYRQGTTSAGLILEEVSGASVAPTMIIKNNLGDFVPSRNADIFIENFNPSIALRSKTDANNNAVTLESDNAAGSIFSIKTRENTNNSLGDTVNNYLEITANYFETFAQIHAEHGTSELPGISFKPSDDDIKLEGTGLYAVSKDTSIPSSVNKLGVSVDGVSKITVQNDDINHPSVIFEGSSAIVVPSGTIAERPIGEDGAMRFNTEVNQFEGFDGAQWGPLGSQIGAVTVDWFARNSDVTVVQNSGYYIDTTNEPVTVTLPPGVINDFVWIADYFGTSPANPITIIGTGDPTNPAPIMGSNEALIVSSANAVVQLTYIDDDYGWKITSGLGEFAGSDAVSWIPPYEWDPFAGPVEPFLSYMVDTSNTPVTVTLPAVPTDPDEALLFQDAYVRVADYYGTSPRNNIIVKTNGAPLNGVLGEDQVIRTANAALTFTYIDSTQGWKITAGSGTGGGSGIDNWEFVSGSVTPMALEAAFAYMVDTTGSAFTGILPANPNQFDIVNIMDHKGTCSTNNINIQGNGRPIVGVAEDLVLNLDRSMIQLTYMGDDDTEGWVITNGVGEGGGGGASRDDWETITTDTVAVIGGDYQCVTADNPITITMPTNPTVNDNVKISDYSGNCFNNNITIVSDKPIMGLPDELILDFNNVTIELTFIDNSMGWKITDGIGEGGSGGGLSQFWEYTNIDKVIEANGAYLVDTLVEEVRLVLPSNPGVNNTLFVSDYRGTASDNNIVIESLSDLIMGASDPLRIDLDNATVQLTFIDSTIGWKIVDGIGEGGGSGSGEVDSITEAVTLITPAQQVVNFSLISDAFSSVFFINGIKLYPSINGIVGDYVVTGNNQITLNSSYPIGSIILGTQNDTDGTQRTVWDFTTIEEESILASGQTIITLSNVDTDFPFSLYINGVRIFQSERTVLSSTQIQLHNTYPSGSKYVAVQNDPTGRS